MKEGWSIKSFGDCIEKVKATTKLQSSLYKDSGTYPIVSQEKELISGYWDIKEDLFCHSTPLVVFGDHTMVVKYIDFDFVVGADGVKILMPKPFLLPKFFYYWVSSVQIQSRGYARHFRYLKETSVPIPSQSEQQRIVDILDAEFAKIDALKENAEKNLQNVKELFQAVLRKELEPKEGWKRKQIGECFHSINNGANIKQSKDAKGIPITRIETLANDIFNRQRMGYADIFDSTPYQKYILNDGDILMSHINSMKYLGRAVEYNKEENETVLHGMNLLRLIPNTEIVLSKYATFYFKTAAFKDDIESISHQSVNQVSFNVSSLKNLYIPIPTLAEQNDITTKLNLLIKQCNLLEVNYSHTITLCGDLKQALLRKAFNGEL